MLGWIANTVNRLMPKRQTIAAAPDVSRTTDQNSRHWDRADGLSPRNLNLAETRATTRKRARYEALENNCYAKGIVLTLANDTIGTGPRLQLRMLDKDLNNQVETRVAEWAAEMKLAEKLRSMRIAKAVDGATFAHFSTNYSLRGPVKLDLAISEVDHFATPWGHFDPMIDDGIEFDKEGNPIAYYRLKAHPGGDLPGLS